MTFNGIDDVLNANLNYVWDGSTWVAETQPGAAAGSTQVSVTGLTFDTSNALKVNTGSAAAGSTTVNVSSLAGKVTVDQLSTTWAVQVDGRVRAQNSTIGDLLASVQQNSTTWAVQVDGRVRAQNSTIGDFLASVQQNSTTWAVQVDGRVRAQNSTIGDLLASVQQNSTVWQVQAHNSSIGDLLASVQQNSSVWQVQPGSTAYVKTAGFSVDTSNALNVKLDGSTALTIGSIAASAGRLNIGSTATDNAVTATILAGSTLATRPMQSSQADLRMTAYQSSAAELKVTIYQSSAAELMNKSWTLDGITGAGIESSTFAASTRTSTARGLVTRAAIPDCTSATARLATAGDNAILTSAATTIHVYALSFSAGLASTGTSTGSSGVVVQLQAGTTGARLWTFNWQASSNGEGPHEALAVTPPAYLFRTGAGGSLNAAAGSSGGYISVAAWRE